MRLTLKKIALFVMVIYLILTCYAAYFLLSDKEGKDKDSGDLVKRPSHHAMTPKPQSKAANSKDKPPEQPSKDSVVIQPPAPAVAEPVNFQQVGGDEPDVGGGRGKGDIGLRLDQLRPVKEKLTDVEIWSRAGIGEYTWRHLLGGPLESRLGGVWSYGVKKQRDMKFQFRMGPGVHQSKTPQDVEHLILVLNGRAPDKVDFAKSWLDYLPNYSNLQNVALMIIGSEVCDNDWLLPYMASHGGPIKIVFIVYDGTIVNGWDVLQWPLGVATYRGFPVVESSTLALHMPRPYRCNFMGTVYQNSTREDLLRIVWQNQLVNVCYVKTRSSWEPSEKAESREEYQKILSQSDLTLCPVGTNTESYRLYEACAYGSIPVIEDVRTPGNCADEPLRLLKQMKAPFIFVKDWSELPKILDHEAKKTPGELVQRRTELVLWYDKFKDQLKEIFLDKVQGAFFPQH